MLGKLAVRNTKRSIKDYLIYLITVTIAFSLIFAFNLVASSEEVIELSTGMDTFKYILAFVNVVTYQNAVYVHSMMNMEMFISL